MGDKQHIVVHVKEESGCLNFFFGVLLLLTGLAIFGACQETAKVPAPSPPTITSVTPSM